MRALISVYHKAGIVEFARAFLAIAPENEILASGGTAKHLREAGIAAKDVADMVGEPILGHRVVTLSREVHAGLLAEDTAAHRGELEQRGIPWIDLAVVDLYPLTEEIRKEGSTRESVIDKTDVGGPTMLRAAAKGGRIVVCDPADRDAVLGWLRDGMPDRDRLVTDLAAKAEAICAAYALESARYHGAYDGFVGRRVQTLRYGENAWQEPAALYTDGARDPLALHRFERIEGAEPSYNNLCDLDRALQTATHVVAAFAKNADETPFVAIGMKHGNACGAAIGEAKGDALRKMLSGDPRAIFGGTVLVTFDIGEVEAELLLRHKSETRRILDMVVAPDFSEEAKNLLARKGGKCRLLRNDELVVLSDRHLDRAPRFRYVRGGFLRQPNYTFVPDFRSADVRKIGKASPTMESDMLLAWAVGATSNSNTVTLAKTEQVIGNGVGQQDRVGAAMLAIRRAVDAGHDTVGAVAYSDSFFPFPDGPHALADAGVSAILATSGSVKDEQVIEACEKRGVVLYLIPDAAARGFFGH